MKVTLKKSRPAGMAAIPASKSLTIRALFCAALARGKSIIKNPLASEDTEAAISVLRRLGAEITAADDSWRVAGGSLKGSGEALHCGESATTMRFLIPVCATIAGRHVITGGPSLTRRPVSALIDGLHQVGINAQAASGGFPPVIIEGGMLQGGEVAIPGNISSQYVSGLLLAAPLAEQGLTVRLTTPLASKPYIQLTLESLERFGISVQTGEQVYTVSPQAYRPANVTIEGDWSSASYFIALGAGSPHGITVTNVRTDSRQGDRIIIDIVRSMGAGVEAAADSVTVKRGTCRPFTMDMTDCIDLLPTAGILAALAEGTSELNGIAAGRIKESNRVAAVRQGLEQLGVQVAETEDRLVIHGPLVSPGEGEVVVIDSFDDHRIAMAFGVLGALLGGIAITGAECVAKTFPDFWQAMKLTGVEMEIQP